MVLRFASMFLIIAGNGFAIVSSKQEKELLFRKIFFYSCKRNWKRI